MRVVQILIDDGLENYGNSVTLGGERWIVVGDVIELTEQLESTNRIRRRWISKWEKEG